MIVAETYHDFGDDFPDQPGTVVVPNRQNLPILIDEADAPRVLSKIWSVFRRRNRFTISRLEFPNGKKITLQLHRFVMDAPPGVIVDHRNGNTLDNRRSNLRFADAKGNSRNRRATAGGKSAFKGVCTSMSKSRPWRAYILVGGRQRHLGVFVSEEEAARSYDAAARVLFGEFASLNFPGPGEQSAHRSGAVSHLTHNQPDSQKERGKNAA